MRKLIFLILFIVFFNDSFSQENVESQHHFRKHDITFFLGHTHVLSGFDNALGEDEWLVMPSFGLNYNYHFNEKWALGIHNHMIIEEFLVTNEDSQNSNQGSEDDENGYIERDKPISVALTASYKIHKHIAFILGAGMEFSSHENYKLVKFGVEFPFHIPNDWEVIGVL